MAVVFSEVPADFGSVFGEQMYGVSGLNVEPGNARELARAIEALTADAATYGRYAAGARQRYLDLFTKDHMIDKCLTLYSSLYGK